MDSLNKTRSLFTLRPITNLYWVKSCITQYPANRSISLQKTLAGSQRICFYKRLYAGESLNYYLCIVLQYQAIDASRIVYCELVLPAFVVELGIMSHFELVWFEPSQLELPTVFLHESLKQGGYWLS